jgi:D-beta-D-heptose 7-phosphate kinase/D-beta-D-heptose 1-phosphate adenosyltransferase
MDIQQQKKYRVLLIGDSCIDVYRYGTVDRISPEAPVPVFKFKNMETRQGMAANVQKNLEAFGIDVTSYFGTDSTKTRIVDLKSKQHILRIDDDVSSDPLIFGDIKDRLKTFDAIVISDYDKGWVSYELVENISRTYQGPIFIDTKKRDLSRFGQCYVKVNELEYNNRYSVNETLIITLGERGAVYRTYNQDDGKKEKWFPTEKVEVVDVCGAGDTFLSAMVANYLNSSNIEDAIIFANRASGIAVQHSGVYVLTEEDIKNIERV